MTGVQITALRKLSEEEVEQEALYSSRKQDVATVASAETDDRGHYRLFGLRPGEYYIRARDSLEDRFGGFQWRDMQIRQSLGSDFAPVYYAGVLQREQAQIISLRAGEEVQADFSMRRTKTVEIAGRVIGPEGAAKNAWVHLESTEMDDGGWDNQGNTNSDEQGNFRLKGVPPGSYTIVAQTRATEQNKYYHARQKIEVGNENIDSIVITLGGGSTLRGRVTVAGPGAVTMDQIHVALRSIDQGEQWWGNRGEVKKDGTFEITSIKDGNYSVSVWVRGAEEDWYIKSARIGPDDVLEKGLQIEKGASGGRLEITISSANAQLEGSVTDGDKAVIGAHILVMPEPQTPYNRFHFRSLTSDQTGLFLIAKLTPGKYRVTAKSPMSGGSLKSAPQIVELSENDHKTIQLTIVKPATQ
jgi:hypothetical protein